MAKKEREKEHVRAEIITFKYFFFLRYLVHLREAKVLPKVVSPASEQPL